MPLQATSGAASYDAFGGGVPVVPAYIEEVFSCFLYTGNGSTQTITNNIDLSTKGGIVWCKGRSAAGYSNVVYDTINGANKRTATNLTNALTTATASLTAFNTTGFSLGADAGGEVNENAINYVSWTFRKQPKFFDVLTYSGTGANRTIAHNLGSVPGCIMVKRTDTFSDWAVYHRSLANTQYLVANTTAAAATGATWWNSTTPTSSVFSLGTDATVNSSASGATYVAYLFAHDAGGFGLTGTDNVISCGSLTADNAGGGAYAGGATVNLGYEPQFVLLKETSSTDSDPNWIMVDTFRGYRAQETSGSDVGQQRLRANTAGAEANAGGCSFPTSTGFSALQLTGGATYIYIAIRRGPMKVPTSGTSVFGLNARTGTGAVATVTGGQTDDAVIVKNRGSAVASLFSSRLTGKGYLVTSSTAAEVTAGTTILQANPWDVMDGVKVGTTSTITNSSGGTFINYLFKRAPSFFDEVCYTGTGTGTIAHNLTVVPQMIIGRFRSDVGQWYVFHEALGATGTILFNSNPATVTAPWTLTSTTFQYDTLQINTLTYVTYLFATCAGVSKVGSYTGNGSTQTIDCGFGANGARFVLIKRTDASGDWYVYDTARGMTVLTDPYWLINSSAAEVATLGSVTTVSTGFAVDNSILAGINAASPAAYIFLAIA
jgi:hypothetical protein